MFEYLKYFIESQYEGYEKNVINIFNKFNNQLKKINLFIILKQSAAFYNISYLRPLFPLSFVIQMDSEISLVILLKSICSARIFGN